MWWAYIRGGGAYIRGAYSRRFTILVKITNLNWLSQTHFLGTNIIWSKTTEKFVKVTQVLVVLTNKILIK